MRPDCPEAARGKIMHIHAEEPISKDALLVRCQNRAGLVAGEGLDYAINIFDRVLEGASLLSSE